MVIAEGMGGRGGGGGGLGGEVGMGPTIVLDGI